MKHFVHARVLVVHIKWQFDSRHLSIQFRYTYCRITRYNKLQPFCKPNHKCKIL